MGTKFSLKDPNPGTWFSFNEADPESGKICIRVMNAAKMQEITKATTKKRTEYKQGQRFEVAEVLEEKRSQMLWDYSIADWERLEDDDGKPIPCTAENKAKLMLENIGFSSFVSACISKLNADIDAIRENVEKN
jgi:hypothetical protein